jgi:hypothetical protein
VKDAAVDQLQKEFPDVEIARSVRTDKDTGEETVLVESNGIEIPIERRRELGLA